jgi:lipoprotein NlpD
MTSLSTRLDPQRRAPRRAATLLAALAILGGCTEVSLNDAPIVDKSNAHGLLAAGDAMYTVQRGDTLFHIAQSFQCTVQDLALWNGLADGAPLTVGQRLRVRAPQMTTPAVPVQAVAPPPPPDAPAAPVVEPEASAVPIPITDAVQTRTLDATPAPAGATAAPPAIAPLASAPAAAPAAAAVPSPSAPMAASVPPNSVAGGAGTGWIWPVAGRVTVPFDPSLSKGIDIAVTDGSPVLAVADGEVSYTGSPRDYGNLVILRHGSELLSVYAHNKSIGVTQGQQVKRGQTIATAGSTSDAPAILHFEVRRKGVPVDPLDYLPVR